MTLTTMPDSGFLSYKLAIRQNPPAPVFLTAPAYSQTTTLFGIPGGHAVVGVRIQLVTAFTCTGLSTCTMSVGAYTTAAAITNFYCPAFSITGTGFSYWSPLAMFTTDPHDVTVTFLSTGALLSAISAGELEVTVLYRPLF